MFSNESARLRSFIPPAFHNPQNVRKAFALVLRRPRRVNEFVKHRTGFDQTPKLGMRRVYIDDSDFFEFEAHARRWGWFPTLLGGINSVCYILWWFYDGSMVG